MNKHINIKDYPCGTGKTTSMIKEFQQNKKYLVILPLLSEVKRVIDQSQPILFEQPTTDENEHNTKAESIKELLLTGQNIATTHNMYERLVRLAREGLLDDYHIIIDEVPDVVKSVSSKTKTSIEEFYLKTGYIELEKTGLVRPTNKWRQNKEEVSDTLNSKILSYAETGCLYLLGEHMFVWAMPSELLSAGLSVTIMTYKSEGSLLTSYLNKLSLPYFVNSSEFKERHFKTAAKELINLQDIPSISKLNLSHSGQAKGMSQYSYYSKISGALKNLRSRQLKGVRLNDILVTCKKDAWFKRENKAGVFAKDSKMFQANWIANTTRGTNDYAHCSHLIYLYDQHVNPVVGRWVNNSSRSFDDAYALTELIQWVWRSRVRRGEPITLYLPAPRMRRIFLDWLDDDYNIIHSQIHLAA
ncbi:hypothetical protein N9X39_06335 [Alphaproteobacteria bacterium]|nr:hypothetical protein [Alphaproteobacteria bacterium]